jgi:hypothetical protein
LRKFLSWCETVLGATGTDAQKIQAGYAALAAVADTTSGDHVLGLAMNDPADWVRAGFAPRNAALDGTAHDSGTPGAVPFQAAGAVVGPFEAAAFSTPFETGAWR